MRVADLAPVFVLHRRRYGDTSLLLELFSRTQGRVAAIARGAGQGRSARAGLLQPFVPLLAACSGRGQVSTLAKAEPAGKPVRLQGTALFCGLYLNELLIRFLPRHDAHAEIFDRYAAILPDLMGAADVEPLLRGFELDLLRGLGFAPELTLEADGATPVRPERRYRYRPEFGAEPAGADSAHTVRGQTLLDLAAGVMPDGPGRGEARRLMRRLIAHHLGGRPLKSRELFRVFNRK